MQMFEVVRTLAVLESLPLHFSSIGQAVCDD